MNFGLIDKLEIRIKNEIENFKIDVENEIKDEMEVQKGLEMIEKFKVHIKTEIQNFKIEQIKAAIKSKFDLEKMNFGDEFIEEFTIKIATKVVRLLKESESKEEEKVVIDDCWNIHTDFLVCNPCLMYKDKAPKELKKSNKGSYGIVKKEIGHQMKRNQAEHCKLGLHNWCKNKLKTESKKKDEEKELNKLAGQKIVKNGLFCFLRSGSAADFLALNSKDSSASDISNVATKNDSKKMFFKLRNVAFEKVSQKTTEFFKTVNCVSVTLDKVTVHRQSHYREVLQWKIYM